MIALILAAGMSKRLRPLTNTAPKCLLPVGDQTLLTRYLDLLEQAGIVETIIVTGFNAQAVESEVARWTGDMPVRCIENKDYETTHPIQSFLHAESFLTDDFLLLNSDIYFPLEVLKKLDLRPDSCIAVDSTAAFIDGEMFVNYTPDMRVTEISKNLKPQESNQAKSVQVAKFTRTDIPKLLERAHELSEREEVFYPAQAYDRLIAMGRLYAVDVAGVFTHELDTPTDYEALLQHLG